MPSSLSMFHYALTRPSGIHCYEDTIDNNATKYFNLIIFNNITLLDYLQRSGTSPEQVCMIAYFVGNEGPLTDHWQYDSITSFFGRVQRISLYKVHRNTRLCFCVIYIFSSVFRSLALFNMDTHHQNSQVKSKNTKTDNYSVYFSGMWTIFVSATQTRKHILMSTRHREGKQQNNTHFKNTRTSICVSHGDTKRSHSPLCQKKSISQTKHWHLPCKTHR